MSIFEGYTKGGGGKFRVIVRCMKGIYVGTGDHKNKEEMGHGYCKQGGWWMIMGVQGWYIKIRGGRGGNSNDKRKVGRGE